MNAKKVLNSFITLLYPDKCIFCDQVILTKDQIKICLNCEKDNKPIEDKNAMWIYEGGAKSAVLNFKYKNRREYGKTIGALMAEDIVKKAMYTDIDVIIPVPLHKSKIKQRGYNQTEILADFIGKNLKINVDSKSLVRAKKTEPQMNLGKEQRQKNIMGAMKVILPDNISGKNILLIDDIYTTGATINECGRVLELAGAKSVSHFCACLQP